MDTQKTCCACGTGCCTPKEPKKKVTIDFLYLDTSVCTRCQGTEKALEEAVADAGGLLNAAGMEITVNKVNIATRELAVLHRFESSPTIRVNGKDIDADIKESVCESCGDLCGESVDCRVFTYQGAEYTVPPKAMIVNAILSSVYGSSEAAPEKEYRLPANLAAFFDAMEKKNKK